MAQGDPLHQRVNLSSDPVLRYVQVTKPGGVPGVSEQDLIDHAWLQRLRRIHQLQSAWWVFSSAEHSRFQHSLGASQLAGDWAQHLEPTLRTWHPDLPSGALVVETLRIAALLHDVGHGPFGHFFDEHYLSRWGIDHEAIGRHLILGELAPLVAGIRASPAADFEAGEAIDPSWVAYLISPDDLPGFEAPRWLAALKPLLVGPFSADNMDYVPRDAYVCGVAAGPVDVPRIIHYSFISEEGLTLHTHGAEALFMFLNARLYLYHQVYYHRTVRRIDLQLREIFAPTMDEVLGGNPLQNMSRYQRLNEWFLITEVDRWAREGESALRRQLGREWGEVVARRLRWQMVYSGYFEAHEAAAVLPLSREDFDRLIRERLPVRLKTLRFEVDVASQESRAFNPLMESGDILLYDPLQDSFQRSRVLDLFRRLPVRMALFRIFGLSDLGAEERSELVRAAHLVLGEGAGPAPGLDD